MSRNPDRRQGTRGNHGVPNVTGGRSRPGRRLAMGNPPATPALCPIANNRISLPKARKNLLEIVRWRSREAWIMRWSDVTHEFIQLLMDDFRLHYRFEPEMEAQGYAVVRSHLARNWTKWLHDMKRKAEDRATKHNTNVREQCPEYIQPLNWERMCNYWLGRGGRRQEDQEVSVGGTTEVYQTGEEEEMAINQLRNNVSDDLQEVSVGDDSDDQPLLTWLEGISQGRRTLGQSPAIDGTVPEDRSLPFVKSYVLWKDIEADEVFRKFPQKPHFLPLASYNESSREGFAIDLMETFISIVDKVSSLRFDFSRSHIDDNLETLLELENHGFEVKKLRDRLNSLRLMKDKEEELQDHLKEIKCQIGQKNEEMSKFDERLDQIEREMSMLQEERNLLVGINEEMRSVQRQFEALVAAPW